MHEPKHEMIFMWAKKENKYCWDLDMCPLMTIAQPLLASWLAWNRDYRMNLINRSKEHKNRTIFISW
jgi:hypothetical protein